MEQAQYDVITQKPKPNVQIDVETKRKDKRGYYSAGEDIAGPEFSS